MDNTLHDLETAWTRFGNHMGTKLKQHLEQLGDNFGTTLWQLWDHFATSLQHLFDTLDNFMTTSTSLGHLSLAEPSLTPLPRGQLQSFLSCIHNTNSLYITGTKLNEIMHKPLLQSQPGVYLQCPSSFHPCFWRIRKLEFDFWKINQFKT